MNQIVSTFRATSLLAAVIAASACTPAPQSGSTLSTNAAASTRNSSPAPVPRVTGSTDGPGFGPGVGAGLDSGIGLQPSLGLVP